jgi:hypothetical protein
MFLYQFYYYSCIFFLYQVQMLMFYNVKITNSSMAGKKMRCTVDNYGVVDSK